MKRPSFFNSFSALFPEKKAKTASPIALHSMLLALEPRLVFDASVAAVAEAVDTHDVQPAMQAEAQNTADPAQAEADSRAEESPGAQDDAPDASRTEDQSREGAAQARTVGIAPLLAETGWSEPSTVTFDESRFTVAEDELLTLGVGGVTITDADSDDLRVTISVEHGTLFLDYVPGIVGNQYQWNESGTEVTFEAVERHVKMTHQRA